MTSLHIDEVRAMMAEARPIDVPSDRRLRRSIRIRGGLTIEAVANALGVSPTTVYRWEIEGRKPWQAHRDSYGRILAVCLDLAAPIDTALRRVA